MVTTRSAPCVFVVACLAVLVGLCNCMNLLVSGGQTYVDIDPLWVRVAPFIFKHTPRIHFIKIAGTSVGQEAWCIDDVAKHFGGFLRIRKIAKE